ncbi:hypothetical protein AC622_12840 [Bacillus sp. FJAT-27916]|uniref:flagellar FlbD family protein n=1 Tax=Bacillaceae TaxID=186817 RepID=UPI000670F08E|nr:flagellar FlbD family protein [Bacillus sp. FJAT-27916]KMY44998.1 hypothetical protein AC622_12840 [Bacillus sp. FJAT-27916]
MIKVRKLNGKEYYLNALYIESIESNPDTTLTLTNGKKLVVADDEKMLVHSVMNFYRQVNLLKVPQEEVLDSEK